MKHNNFILKIRQIFIWGITPALLLAFAVFGAFSFDREVNFNTLQYANSESQIIHPQKQLLKDEIIEGKFIAQENNLGAIALKITTYNRINDDILSFQLKEAGQKDWYCYNVYFTDRFPDGELYPFGFPIITDSKGKTYEFQIISVKGTPENSIGFLEGSHSFVSRYTFEKNQLIISKKVLISFVFEKICTHFTDSYFLLYFSKFLIPLLLYFIFLSSKDMQDRTINIIKSKWIGIIIIILMEIVFVFQPILAKSNIILYIASTSLFVSIGYHLKPSIFFRISLFLVLLCFISMYFVQFQVVNRLAIVIFFLITIGLIQIMLTFMNHDTEKRKTI